MIFLIPHNIYINKVYNVYYHIQFTETPIKFKKFLTGSFSVHKINMKNNEN
jgi:hypothetical protein